jgi:hypothetical protein
MKTTFTFRALTVAVIAAAAATVGARTVQADVIELTASGTQSFSANTTNTIFSLTDIQPAGSGIFKPFVRIEGGSDEQGYNTQDPANTMDNHTNGPAQPVITMNTVVTQDYKINLALDLNEPGAAQLSTLTLEDLVLVISTNGDKSGPAATNPWSIQSLPIDIGDIVLYTMSSTTRTDAGFVGNSFSIHMDANDNLASGNGGSGQADLLVQLDLAGIDLTGLLDSNHYLYVYSRFSGNDQAFEEWRIQTPTDPNTGTGVPEPASLAVMGLGAVALLAKKRRQR